MFSPSKKRTKSCDYQVVRLTRHRIRNLRRLKKRLKQRRPPFGPYDGDDDDPEAQDIINQLLEDVAEVPRSVYIQLQVIMPWDHS